MSDEKKSLFGWKTKAGCGVVLALLIFFGGCWAISNYVYSDSFREGTLQKFGNKGLFYKTHEGELALPGFGGSQTGKEGQSGGNTWAFSVEAEDVVATLKEAAPRQWLRCHYKEYLISWPYSTKYRVWKVESISAPPATTPKTGSQSEAK